MWFFDPYELEWRLARTEGRLANRARRAHRRGGHTAPPRPLVGSARRVMLALRVLVDETVAGQVAETLSACRCEQSGA